MATFKVLNDIKTIGKRQYCAAVFIDLAKAFDTVNHRSLIGRLNSLGFTNDCLAWFTNYFSNRVQCVKSEGLFPGPLVISMAVPQGLNLGPTLFSVYINDVSLAAGDSLIHLYADDTIMYTSGTSLDTGLTNHQTTLQCHRTLPISQQSLLYSCCQTCPRKTDYPTDPKLQRCHLQNSLQHATQQIGCSLSQCHPFCHQSPIHYPPLRPVCSHWLVLATYSSPNPLAPGHL